jgi:hypothetical protein
MIMQFRRIKGLTLALLAGGAAAACGTAVATPSNPVAMSTPSVTYQYRTDQELVQANTNAATYCSQYSTVPRTGPVTNNADGTRTIVFDCVRTASAPVAVATPAPLPVNPPLAYTYRTDQELLVASQNATAACARYGALPAQTGIVANTDGSRTVTYTCTR